MDISIEEGSWGVQRRLNRVSVIQFGCTYLWHESLKPNLQQFYSYIVGASYGLDPGVIGTGQIGCETRISL